jgi:hypothetical protein
MLRLTALAFLIISIFSFRSQNILDPLPTKSSWKTLADATPPLPCFYPHSEWAAYGARCKLGFDLKPRSITPVMNLGLLGLPSIARS